VAVVTGAIELLKGHVPVLSLAVPYLLAVLPVAIVSGMGYAVAVSIASMAEFNFLFLPPLYRFTLVNSATGSRFSCSSLIVICQCAVTRRVVAP